MVLGPDRLGVRRARPLELPAVVHLVHRHSALRLGAAAHRARRRAASGTALRDRGDRGHRHLRARVRDGVSVLVAHHRARHDARPIDARSSNAGNDRTARAPVDRGGAEHNHCRGHDRKPGRSRWPPERRSLSARTCTQAA